MQSSSSRPYPLMELVAHNPRAAKRISLISAFLILFGAFSAHAYAPMITCSSDGSHALTSTANPPAFSCTAISGGSVNLGTSVSAANPRISGDASSGFYTPSTSKVAVTAAGTEAVAWTSTAENILATDGLLLNGLNGISLPASGTDTTSIAIGPSAALYQSTTNSDNVAIGMNALDNSSLASTANEETIVGVNAGQSLYNGNLDTFIGYNAGSTSNGSYITCLGANSCYNGAGNYQIDVGASTRGSGNGVAIGYQALQNNYGGSGNVAIGYGAGKKLTSAGANVYIGYNVGSTTLATGSNDILIGNSSAVDAPASTTSNFLDIGNVIFATGMGGTLSAPTGNVAIDNDAPNTGAILDLSGGTNSLLLPSGTTGQRPASPVPGMIRYNSDIPGIEAYYNNTWNTL